MAGAAALRLDSVRSQVVGCNKDIRGEKEYYQRYRICEAHLKMGTLKKEGRLQRFCQQCGRFHCLEDFDGEKRCAPWSPHPSQGAAVNRSSGALRLGLEMLCP